jgi:hypothetical protein
LLVSVNVHWPLEDETFVAMDCQITGGVKEAVAWRMWGMLGVPVPVKVMVPSALRVATWKMMGAVVRVRVTTLLLAVAQGLLTMTW